MATSQRWDRRLSTGKIARALGLSNSTVQAYARGGLLPASTTPGRQYRFNLEEVRQVLENDGLLPTADLPALDDGPDVLVSMRAEPTTDERGRAYAELRGFVPTSPDGGAVGAATDVDGSDYSLDGLVQRAPAAVASFLQLR